MHTLRFWSRRTLLRSGMYLNLNILLTLVAECLIQRNRQAKLSLACLLTPYTVLTAGRDLLAGSCDGTTYTVKSGDTLSKLAKECSVKAIASASPSITDPDSIKAGDSLCLPSSCSAGGGSSGRSSKAAS